MIIVDTNIIAYFYLEGEYTKEAEKLFSHDSTWIAPLLWRSEFRNVLTHYLRKKIISKQDAINIMQQAEIQMKGNELPIDSANVFDLVSTSECSAYDCEFMCLARELEIPFITLDKKILSHFPKEAMSLASFLSKVSSI